MAVKINIVLNRLAEDENKILVLNDLSKDEIIKQLVSVCTNRDRNILAVSQDPIEDHKPDPSSYWTLSEYLESIDLQVNTKERMKINYHTSRLYREKHGRSPRVIYRKSLGNGKQSIKLAGYLKDDLRLIDEAIELAGLSDMAG